MLIRLLIKQIIKQLKIGISNLLKKLS